MDTDGCGVGDLVGLCVGSGVVGDCVGGSVGTEEGADGEQIDASNALQVLVLELNTPLHPRREILPFPKLLSQVKLILSYKFSMCTM